MIANINPNIPTEKLFTNISNPVPGDPESAYILYGGQHYPLRLTDRVANGKTKRQTALSIDYAKEGMKNVH